MSFQTYVTYFLLWNIKDIKIFFFIQKKQKTTYNQVKGNQNILGVDNILVDTINQ